MIRLSTQNISTRFNSTLLDLVSLLLTHKRISLEDLDETSKVTWIYLVISL